LFTGGGSNVVDVYNATNNTWTTSLSQGSSHFAGASAGDKLLFAGGSGTVDIFSLVHCNNPSGK
jgi:hypothetical protein